VIGQAKAELIDAAAFADAAAGGPDPFRRRIAEVYAEYQRRLLAANAMDFDDLLLVAVQVLQRCEDVRTAYQQRFRHVLVDEYQDTNKAQNELVMLLARDHGNVCVVGDSDQSIYRFRAADIRNILDFERSFPMPRCHVGAELPVHPDHLGRGQRGDRPQLGSAPKRLFTVDDVGPPICRYRAENEYDEASFVASEIFRLRNAEQLAFGDVAIFYRTNAQSRALEEELVRAGVPTRSSAARVSTTAGRSRTSSPTSGCWPTPMTRSPPAAWSTRPSAASGRCRSPGSPHGRRRTT